MELIEQHNLTLEEYKKILEILGREPNLTELGIFSVMWSEHCSYKSSKIHLKRLPTKGERVIVPPGENAGVVDIGDGWCVAFKIESHNHPSFIEPYQGAATGVGGILRDVFTMGARPMACMNSLRFGPLDCEKRGRRNKSIMRGVVAGIAHYGNCFGVPTVGGEVFFDESYSLNPLVNAFALGIVRKDQIFFGRAEGIGNSVIYVGAKTGRDGIHGATMASAEFDEATLEKRVSVQVGDPFLEKLLLEACLEVMRSGAIEGIQDMGAAGLTSSSVEMAARGGRGIELNLDLVPQRESGMSAYEIMLSESQERMLIVSKKGREKEIIEVFNKWDLDAVVIGKVTEEKRLRVYHKNKLEADLPIDKLTSEAPVYDRPKKARSFNYGKFNNGKLNRGKPLQLSLEKFNKELKLLLASPNICSKRWVYEQYDHMVRTNSVVLPGADAAVIRVKETRKAISMSLDGNGKFCAINPREGAKLTVAEAARNNVCVGGKPIAGTNCLNFASPERPEVMWSFSEVIDGMAEACTFLEIPIVSGNVSFYNETEGKGVLPTPVVGVIGLIEDIKKIVTPGFKSEGDLIALLGETRNDLEASEYEQLILKKVKEELIERGTLPKLNLEDEKKVQQTCLQLANEMLLKSAHDTSEGGLAVAIAESCFSSLNRDAIGAEINLSLKEGISAEALLFGETPSRIVISFSPENRERVQKIAESNKCSFQVIGVVAGKTLKIAVDETLVISEEIAELESIWKNALEKYLI